MLPTQSPPNAPTVPQPPTVVRKRVVDVPSYVNNCKCAVSDREVIAAEPGQVPSPISSSRLIPVHQRCWRDELSAWLPHRLHLCPLVNCTQLHHEEAAMAPSDPRVTEGLDMCLLDSITLVRIDGCTLPIKDLPTAATPPSIFNETVPLWGP
jgi:hypothetical protein